MKDETIQKIVADFRDKLEGANAAKDGGAVATAYVQPIAIWLTENLNQLLTHYDKEKAGEVVRRLEETVSDLEHLASPYAETLSDSQRIDQFCEKVRNLRAANAQISSFLSSQS